MRNSPISALVAGVLLAFVCLPAAAFGQEPENPEQFRTDFALISLYVHADGRVSARVMVFDPKKAGQLACDSRQWTEAMEHFLGGPVKKVVETYREGVDDVDVEDVDVDMDGEKASSGPCVFELVGGIRRDGWINYLESDPGPVLALLRANGTRKLHLQIFIEDKQYFAESTLQAPLREDSSEPMNPLANLTRQSDRNAALAMIRYYYLVGPRGIGHFKGARSYNYVVPVSEEVVPPFRVSYGYRPKDFFLLAPLVLLPLPVFWTLWRRRRVLSQPVSESTTPWWSYARFSRRLEVGLALSWAFVVLGTSVGILLDRLAHFAVGIPIPPQALFFGWDWLSLLVYALPPAVISFLCVYLSYPVYIRLRQLEWTRWDMVWNALLIHIAPWLSLLLFAAVIAAVTNADVHRWITWSIAGVLVGVILPRLRPADAKRSLLPIDNGVVRDRVFELAQRAGVKVNQVYLWPTRSDRAANAAAAVGNKVLLTDYLLRNLSKRQVDWIVAHELVHLRHRHPGMTLAGGGGLWFIIVVIYLGSVYLQNIPFLSSNLQGLFDILSQMRYGFLLLLYMGYTWVRNFRSRRHEFVADGEAVAIVGGDAEAGITALVKLARLNQMPDQWGRVDEYLLTHPSDSKRVQALLDDNEIDPERLPAILDTIDQDEDRYPLPADTLQDERLIMAELKTRRASFLQWGLIALIMVLPALLARGIEASGWHDAMAWFAFGGGILFSLVMLLIFLGYGVVWGERRLRERLSIQWKDAGLDVEAWHGIFVGFAPARVPRVYESSYDWDVGFLFLTADRLCYFGGKTRFALRRDQIRAFRLGPGAPRWGKSIRVYVTWRDDQGVDTTWNLRPAGVVNVHAMRRQTPPLLRVLQDWHQEPSAAGSLPELLASLQAPAIGKVTSATVASQTSFRVFRQALNLNALCSGGLAFMFGCSFGLYPTPGWGWYAPVLTTLMLIFQRIPLWRYREPRPPKSANISLAKPVSARGE
jgi:Zn-dependent protease with chaperone function